MNRRNSTAVITALLLLSQTAFSQTAAPAASSGIAGLKNIRLVVPFTAGGTTDVQARALALELAKIVNVPVVVDNKPGASGAIAGAEVSRSKADGATLLYSPDMIVTQTPHMVKKMAFDPFTGLSPIARAADAPPVLLANLDMKVNTVAELVAYAKANPGKISYASYGTGTGSHIYGEVLAKNAGLQMTHIPYKGSADAMTDFLTNRVQIMFQAPSVINQFPGKMKVLATAGDSRNPMLPDVPTMQELGFPGFEMGGWVGVFGPGGMAPSLVNELNAAINQALQQPSIAPIWKQQGFALMNGPAAPIATILKNDHDKWGKYFRDVGIQPQ
jgi:tripartite-type tricarboxylate transporter receptor subunit TctC